VVKTKDNMECRDWLCSLPEQNRDLEFYHARKNKKIKKESGISKVYSRTTEESTTAQHHCVPRGPSKKLWIKVYNFKTTLHSISIFSHLFLHHKKVPFSPSLSFFLIYH